MTEFEILTVLADTDGFAGRFSLLNSCHKSKLNRTDRLLNSMHKRGLLLYDLNDGTRLKLSSAGYDRLAELEILHTRERYESLRWLITSAISLCAFLTSLAALLASLLR